MCLYFLLRKLLIHYYKGNIECHENCITFSFGPLSTKMKSDFDHGFDSNQWYFQNGAQSFSF